MKYQDFKDQFPNPYFSTDELKLYFQGDYKYHLRYWRETGKVSKILKGRYLFADSKFSQDLRFELANKIYAPSYISLESSLSYHGIIPESVRVTTSITSRKTRELETGKGVFSYQSVKPDLYHSYKIHTIGERSYAIATVAKTILDYLYLHHEITSVADFIELRWDRQQLQEQLFPRKLLSLAENYTNKATVRRVNLLFDYINA